MAVTQELVQKTPFLTGQEIQKELEANTSDVAIRWWLDGYRETAAAESEQLDVFFRCLSRWYRAQGIEPVHDWVSQQLVESVMRKKRKDEAETSASGDDSILLKTFNESIQKRKMTLAWRASQKGKAHDGLWTVECIVNDVVAGTGIGLKKQTAKAQAARTAQAKMGWVVA